MVRRLRARLAACTAQAGGGRVREAALIRQLQQRIGSANWANWQMTRWTFYDYVRYNNAGTNSIDFFAAPVGATDPIAAAGKTHEQTNLVKVRTFGQVYFIIQQIRTHVFVLPKNRQPAGISGRTTAIFDEYTLIYRLVRQLMAQGTLQIAIGQKQYFDIPTPFLSCPPGFGLDVHFMGAAPSNQAANIRTLSMFVQGDHHLNAIYNVAPPQLVEPEQNVDAKITFDNANSPVTTNLVIGGTVTPLIDIGLLLDGYIIRPSQ